VKKCLLSTVQAMPELDDKLTRCRGGEKFVTKREEKSERKTGVELRKG
jgi:hypothetical protein